MRRRTILRSFLSALAEIPVFRSIPSWAQTPSFPGSHEATLRELAAIVLLEASGRNSTDQVSREFIRWVQEYRPGAEMQNGYGITRVRVEPPSPVAKYLAQLDELSGSVFVNPDPDFRQKQLAPRLKTAGVRDLSGLPERGKLCWIP